MQAKILLHMKDGRRAKLTTTRAELASFFTEHKHEIKTLIVDICLTRWLYTDCDGWAKYGKFRYIPNKPDLWQVRCGKFKPTNQTPFDHM